MIDIAPWVPMMQQCAPAVGTKTLSAVMRVESSGNPFTILDNGPAALPYSQRKHMMKSHAPKSKAEAIILAKELLARGRLLDMGLMQINSRNVQRMGLTLEQVFDPCINIATGASILKENYDLAVSKFGGGQKSLRHALSMYNTGSLYAGAEYVDKIIRAAGVNEGATTLGAGPVKLPSYSTKITHNEARNPFAPKPNPSGVNPYTAPSTVAWGQ